MYTYTVVVTIIIIVAFAYMIISVLFLYIYLFDIKNEAKHIIIRDTEEKTKEISMARVYVRGT